MTTITSTLPVLVTPQLAERLLARACANAPHLRGLVAPKVFAESLERSAMAHFKSAASAQGSGEVERFLASLHLADLALACACMHGNETAWEHFVRTMRPELYGAARAVARDANPHELADAIYAELFGVDAQGRERTSLFRYFHGRSKLSTWLRTIVAQRFVDQVRAQRRTVSLTEDSDTESDSGTALLHAGTDGKPGNTGTLPLDTEREGLLASMQAAIQSAIGQLEARDRLRLSHYYVQDLTLAQVGRLLGESEATTSRKLERTRGDLRKQIESALRERRMSDAQIAQCFDYAREEWPFDLSKSLANKDKSTDATAAARLEGQKGGP